MRGIWKRQERHSYTVPRRDGTALRVAAAALCACWFCAGAWAESIVNTKHNLSATGPGTVRAISEDEICIFCHTPHRARTTAPLWNRRDSTAPYIPYNSPTLKAQPGQPTGASKLCLSCHDGTIALGELVSEATVKATTGGAFMPPGRSRIGADLRDDHPISFDYLSALGRSAGTLTAPGTWDPRVKLDPNSELQCTSCHNPHDNQWGNFLAMSNESALLCRQCHSFPQFSATPHATAPSQWNGAGPDPWPHTEYASVAANSCLNCHVSHHAGGPAELLTSSVEEDVCFVCHNGNVAAFNLQAVFRKISIHPVSRSVGAHKPGESPLDAHGHVECVDCHNPHRAKRGPSFAPAVKDVMRGVTGIDASGGLLPEARYEYEVCFKCHADRAENPINVIPRRIASLNVRREFSPSSPSFHPVEIMGVNRDVPSLISPLTESSLIYCTDCHNNDGARADQIGSAGPHGSNYEFILTRQYTTGDNVSESSQAYALCYGCHSRAGILADQSFREHDKHVREERAPCSVCHDPHGIDSAEGNPVNNAHLTNFDASVVQPDPQTGRLEYRSTGVRSGECYLRCHGENHSPKRY